MKMPILLFLSLVLPAKNFADAGMHRYALEDSVFQTCGEVYKRSMAFSRDVHETVYLLEVYPYSHPGRFLPFPSGATAMSAASWLSRFVPATSGPYALLYSVNGRNTLRCRNSEGNYTELSDSSGGNGALDLDLHPGKAEIWHFFFTPVNAAHVFVITDLPLDRIDGTALMRRVKELLKARYVYLYVRNDPWFLGMEFDPLGYLFTDSFKQITASEYKTSQTLACDTSSGCKLGTSW
jgi:hypothetical protein